MENKQKPLPNQERQKSPPNKECNTKNLSVYGAQTKPSLTRRADEPFPNKQSSTEKTLPNPERKQCFL